MAVNKDFLMGYGAGKASGGGGGGNPNSITTRQATLGTAFDASQVMFIVFGAFENAVTAYVDFTFNGLTVHLPLILVGNTGIGISAGSLLLNSQSYEIANASWQIQDNVVDFSAVYMSSTNTQGAMIDATTMFAQIPCTVTILRHPMPES